ncbi:MAG: dehydratase [Actinoallomurus sp.]|nr:dehydratase [Actinoallomurus sp.]
MITDYFDRIEIGDRHVSRARTITETDIVALAMFTGDWHPAHTEVEYAASDPVFGGRVAHGALALSVALGLVTFWPEAMKPSTASTACGSSPRRGLVTRSTSRPRSPSSPHARTAPVSSHPISGSSTSVEIP